jgi:hypothetical protein
MTTTDTTVNLKALAQATLTASAAVAKAYEVKRFTETHAARTPKGRYAKSALPAIEAAGQAVLETSEAYDAAKTAFLDAWYREDVKQGEARIASLRQSFFEEILRPHNSTSVTNQWSDCHEFFLTHRSDITNKTNNWGIRAFAFDITPKQGFSNIRTLDRSWDKDSEERVDYRLHLVVWYSENGYLSDVRLYSGPLRTTPNDPKRPFSQPIEDSHGIDIDRHCHLGDISISTCNGTTDEVRVWGRTVSIAADLIDAVGQWKHLRAPRFGSACTRAREVLGIPEPAAVTDTDTAA